MDRHAVWLASTVALSLVAATQVPPTLTERYDLENRTSRVSLPRRLDEASGLAVTTDGRVFMHGDERAVVYQVDPAEGTVLKEFSLGVPVLSGDFEGIAIAGDRFFLINSQGLLLEFHEGAEDESVSFRGVDTGLSNRCEVEELAFEPATQALVAACKTVPRRDEDFIVLYRIGLADLSVEAEPLPGSVGEPRDGGASFPLRSVGSGGGSGGGHPDPHLGPPGSDPRDHGRWAGRVRLPPRITSTPAGGRDLVPPGSDVTLGRRTPRQNGRARLTAYSRGPR